MERKINTVLFVLIILVFILSYARVPLIFFQQDEILGLGSFIKEGPAKIFSGFASGDIRHFIPITMAISYFTYALFGLKYWVYDLLGLSFHLINGVLVYFLARRLLKSVCSALVSVLIFFSSSVAAQLIMWPVINLNSIALTFSLIAWIVASDENFFPKIKGFLRGTVVSLFFLMALFSVEYSAGLIFFIPLVLFSRYGKKPKELRSILTPFIFTVFAYLLFRFIPILQNHTAVVYSQGGTFFPVRVFNLVFRYIGQLLFGQSIILSVAKLVQIFAGLSSFGGAYAENFLLPFISEIIGIALFIFSAYFYLRLKVKKPVYAGGFLLCLLFIVFSSLPFLLVPGGTGLSSVIASRYMYFGLAGMAIFVAYFFDIFISSRKKLNFYVVTVLALFLIFSGTIANYQRSNYLYLQGVLRLKILDTIKLKYPTLPTKVIFYTNSDMSYYGLPSGDKILPFQSGFGQTLLVYYSQTEKFPKDFFPGNYLWEITSQGYKEVGDRGFGYFRNFDLMLKTLMEHKLEKESVIAYKFISSSNALIDITHEVRDRIVTETVKTR